jgi:hypothetical protein
MCHNFDFQMFLTDHQDPQGLSRDRWIVQGPGQGKKGLNFPPVISLTDNSRIKSSNKAQLNTLRQELILILLKDMQSRYL